jgi:hypothetical protein
LTQAKPFSGFYDATLQSDRSKVEKMMVVEPLFHGVKTFRELFIVKIDILGSFYQFYFI